MSTIRIDSSEEGDWVAVYVDGNLVQSGHSVRVPELLRTLGHQAVACEMPADEMPGAL